MANYKQPQLQASQLQPAARPLVALKEVEPFVTGVEPLGSTTKPVNDHYIDY